MISLTIRIAALLAVLLSPSAFAQDEAIEPGVILRIWDMDRPVHALPTPAAGAAPNFAETRGTIDFGDGQAAFSEIANQFYTEVTGKIRVGRQGDYAFRLIADDGADLRIDGQPVVDHDGLHAATPKDGEIPLGKGWHDFKIRHFDSGGGKCLVLQWRPPGADQFTTVPLKALGHAAAPSLDTTPGKKAMVPPLRRGRPGDGSPLTFLHPGYRLERIARENLRPAESPIAERATRELPIIGRSRRPGLPAHAWLPPETGSIIQAAVHTLVAGPHVGQTLIGDVQTGAIWRLYNDENADGACIFRFGAGSSGVRAFQRGADGGVYVQWRNGDEWSRLSATGDAVFEMLAVRARCNGLEITFTRPLDARVGWDPAAYLVEQWPYDVATGASPTRAGVATPVRSASVSPDRRTVFLEIDGLKPERVIYLRLLAPCLDDEQSVPLATEAWYTLRTLPAEGVVGVVRERPPQPEQNALTDTEAAAGWRLLFDGQTTAGWRGFKQDAAPAGWQVIHGELTRVAGGGDIMTEDQFADFELRLEWRICTAGNSGIIYRVGEGEIDVWRTGPEMQVLDNGQHIDGGNPLTSAGSCYALYAPSEDVTAPVGLWNRVRLVVRGNHVEHWLNDIKVVEYEINSPDWRKRYEASKFKDMPQYGQLPRGHIALQDHGDRVAYRNIKIRELKSTP